MAYTLVRGAVVVAVPGPTPTTDPGLAAMTAGGRELAWRQRACDRRVLVCLFCAGCFQAVVVWGLFGWAVGTVAG